MTAEPTAVRGLFAGRGRYVLVDRGCELIGVLPDEPDALLESRIVLPCLLRFEAFPRPEAHEPAGLVHIASQTERPRPWPGLAPGGELAPGRDEGLLLARPHDPDAVRVRLRHSSHLP